MATSQQSPEELRAALQELSSSLTADDFSNPLRLVKARVELLLNDNQSAAQDCGIYLNASNDSTDPFFRATARAIRALAAEELGNKAEAVQELMVLETMTGQPSAQGLEVPTEPAWVAASLGGFLANLPHPNPANAANQAYFHEWKQRLLSAPLISSEAMGVHVGDAPETLIVEESVVVETPLISEEAEKVEEVTAKVESAVPAEQPAAEPAAAAAAAAAAEPEPALDSTLLRSVLTAGAAAAIAAEIPEEQEEPAAPVKTLIHEPTDTTSVVAISGEKTVADLITDPNATSSSFDTGSLMRAVMAAGDEAAVPEELGEITTAEASAKAATDAAPIVYPGEQDSTLLRSVESVDPTTAPLKQDLRDALDNLDEIGLESPAEDLGPETPAWEFKPPPAYNAEEAKKLAFQPLFIPPAATTYGKAPQAKTDVELQKAAEEYKPAVKAYEKPEDIGKGVAAVVAAVVPKAVVQPKAVSLIGFGRFSVVVMLNQSRSIQTNSQTTPPKDTRGVLVDPATYVPPAPKPYTKPTLPTYSTQAYANPNKHTVKFSDPPSPLPASILAAPSQPWLAPTQSDAVAGIQGSRRLKGESLEPSSVAIMHSDTGKFGTDFVVKVRFGSFLLGVGFECWTDWLCFRCGRSSRSFLESRTSFL